MCTAVDFVECCRVGRVLVADIDVHRYESVAAFLAFSHRRRSHWLLVTYLLADNCR